MENEFEIDEAMTHLTLGAGHHHNGGWVLGVLNCSLLNVNNLF